MSEVDKILSLGSSGEVPSRKVNFVIIRKILHGFPSNIVYYQLIKT